MILTFKPLAEGVSQDLISLKVQEKKYNHPLYIKSGIISENDIVPAFLLKKGEQNVQGMAKSVDRSRI